MIYASIDTNVRQALTGAVQPNWHAKSIFQSSGLKSIYDQMRRQVGIHNAENIWAKERKWGGGGHLVHSHEWFTGGL